MLLTKEEYARKIIHNGRSVLTENSVTQDKRSASLGKPRDAELVTKFSIRTSLPLQMLIFSTDGCQAFLNKAD